MFTSALCWSGGFFVSAIGVYLHNLWIVYLGYGVLGGIGLGIAYISPVSTLIRWFPDRPGMATGMAIMGFGGGAFIAAPLSVWLMSRFSTPTHVGVAETFIVMGLIYLCFMMVGAAIVRVPPPGWQPAGYVAPVQPKRLVTTRDVYVYDALKTPQFWLVWLVFVPQRDRRHRRLGSGLGDEPGNVPSRSPQSPHRAWSGLFSLFNMGGRYVWSSISDYIGRKNTYFVFFALGTLLYAWCRIAVRSAASLCSCSAMR